MAMRFTIESGKNPGQVIARHPENGKICFPDRTVKVGTTWEGEVVRESERVCNIRLLRESSWTWEIKGGNIIITSPDGYRREISDPVSIPYGFPKEMEGAVTTAWETAKALAAKSIVWGEWTLKSYSYPSKITKERSGVGGDVNFQEKVDVLTFASGSSYGSCKPEEVDFLVNSGFKFEHQERFNYKITLPGVEGYVTHDVPRGDYVGARIESDRVIYSQRTYLGNVFEHSPERLDRYSKNQKWWDLLNESDLAKAKSIIEGVVSEETKEDARDLAQSLKGKIETLQIKLAIINLIAEYPENVQLYHKSQKGGTYISEDERGTRSFPDYLYTQVSGGVHVLDIPGHVTTLSEVLTALRQ